MPTSLLETQWPILMLIVAGLFRIINHAGNVGISSISLLIVT